MMFIDPDVVTERLPNGWAATARAASKELENAVDQADRARVLKEHSGVWRELKETLASVSDGKCWYCEVRDYRGDNAVDHFRPKGRLAEDSRHPGYWWLAFDASNLRFSCTYCNSRRIDVSGGTSGGKQDHFPIARESDRARVPSQPVTKEVPLLLDACSAEDVTMLWFDDSGQARLNTNSVTNDKQLALERVTTAVRLYHLDHAPAVGARRRITAKVLRLCDEADAAIDAAAGGDPHAKSIVARTFKELKSMTSHWAEYSTTAKCALRGYRETSPVAKIAAESL